jgi:hypothetical protein
MSRDRALLHIKKVEEFARWCEQQGWIREEAQGEFEVLRMRHGSTRERLYIHGRSSTQMGAALQHVTVWGASERLAREFIRAGYLEKHPPRGQDGPGQAIDASGGTNAAPTSGGR